MPTSDLSAPPDIVAALDRLCDALRAGQLSGALHAPLVGVRLPGGRVWHARVPIPIGRRR
jgi:hypothetical protein